MDGKLYKSLRLGLGLTTDALSRKVGVSTDQIAMMEAGIRPVSESQSRKMIDLLLEADRNDAGCFAECSQILRR